MREYFKNVKWTIREITKSEALEILERTRAAVAEGKCKQRGISEASVDSLRCDIKAGAFIPMNQTIAIDERGFVVDGQHRLQAIFDSDRTTLCSVSTGWPITVRVNGVDMDFIDAIDRGRRRGIGQQLNLKGYSNGQHWAAVAKAIAVIATQDDNLSISTYQTEFIIEKLYAKDIETIFGFANNSRQRTTYVCAPLSMLHNAEPSKACEFAEKFFSLTDLGAGHPALALDSWIRNHKSNAMSRMVPFRVTCACLYHFSNRKNLSKAYASSDGLEWLLSLQKTNVRKIHELLQMK